MRIYIVIVLISYYAHDDLKNIRNIIYNEKINDMYKSTHTHHL